MTKASDNIYPSMLYVEGTTPSSPSAGQQRLFVRSSDHVLCMVNSSGTVTPLSGSLTNPMSAVGDIIQGTTAGAPARLAAGTAGYVLTSAGAATPLVWAAPAGAAPACYESYLGTDVTCVNSATWYSHANLGITPPAGDYLVVIELGLSSVSASKTGMAIKISTGGSLSSGVLTGDTAVRSIGGMTAGTDTNDYPMAVSARVTVNGSTIIRASVLNSRGSSDGVILTTSWNGGTANKASSIKATKITSS